MKCVIKKKQCSAVTLISHILFIKSSFLVLVRFSQLKCLFARCFIWKFLIFLSLNNCLKIQRSINQEITLIQNQNRFNLKNTDGIQPKV
jgi:hypothetical protein